MSNPWWHTAIWAWPVGVSGRETDVPLCDRRNTNWLRNCGTGLLATLALAACNAKLPEPDSPGAKLYADRCGTCHRVYAPSSLTFEMWKVQVERKQGTMVRQGLPPLTAAERDVLLAYLKRHSQ